MRKTRARQRVQGLLATTVLLAVSGAGSTAVYAMDKLQQIDPALDAQILQANAQAVTLDPITVQGNGGSTDGYVASTTSVATKTNTPLIDIPQSLNVVTKEFIKDQSFQSLTDVTRYVPGVAVHQGEGNRDELVIRGVDSSANFYVNGFRDQHSEHRGPERTRKHLQQRLLGIGGWQQQYLARPAAHIQADGYREVLI